MKKTNCNDKIKNKKEVHYFTQHYMSKLPLILFVIGEKKYNNHV